VNIGVIDFFSGCGGASTGFAMARPANARFHIISGLDMDPHSCATFRRAHGAPAEELDIRRLLTDDDLRARLIASWNLDRFDKVFFIGCAPCQGFAAHRKSVSGVDLRRSLLVAFCRIVDIVRPDGVFIENVPDLLSRRHWPYFTAGRNILQDAGYSVRARIYNFAGFGLPQERFRATVLAFPHPFRMPEPLLDHEHFASVRSAIGKLPPVVPGSAPGKDPMHYTSRHRADTIEILSKIPKDGGNRPVGVGPKCLDRAREAHGGYTDVYGRLAWDKPAVTVTARCRTPSCGRFAHPEQNRGLSIREAALLQGFPPDFVFEGPFDDKYKQIGNAVPPLVAKVFAEHIAQVFETGPVNVSPDDLAKDISRPVGPGFAVTINGIKRRRNAA
jgi:DNA (cytosine-5)-methyltransferase 1